MLRVAVIAAVAASLVAGLSHGQGSSQQTRALPGLPAWTAGYTGWHRINRAPIPPRRSGDAHGGTKNVYASRRPGGGRFPYGTVVVKEIRRPGARFVGVIAAMRKVRGANRPHNDWVMIEWERTRPRARFDVLAEGRICTSCHVQARKDDYVFTRK